MSTFQPGIPSGTVNLDVDYQAIQKNFQQLDTSFGVDHLMFSNKTSQNGYHTTAHLVPVSTVASNGPNNQPINGYTATTGYGQVLSAQINDGINTDQALYFLTGGNRLQQLTRNFVPVASANGYTFLPGGLILQWGTAAIPGTGTTNFNVTTANIFNIQTTLIGSSSASNIVSVVSSAPGSPGSFTWHFTGSSSYTQFFWMAVTN